jgi:hypothetical protein
VRNTTDDTAFGAAHLLAHRLVEAFERHCGELISETCIPGMAAMAAPRRRKRR